MARYIITAFSGLKDKKVYISARSFDGALGPLRWIGVLPPSVKHSCGIINFPWTTSGLAWHVADKT